MTIITENFSGVSTGGAVANAQLSVLSLVKSGTGAATGDANWTYPGSGANGKSVQIVSTGSTDSAYFILKTAINTPNVSGAMGWRWNALPNAGSGSASKLIAVRNSGGNAAQLRYGGSATSSGNVFSVLDAASVVKHTSPAFSVGNSYFAAFVAVAGTTTSNGRIACNIYENGTLWDSYDSGATANTGTTNFVDYRVSKMDGTTATADGSIGYFTLNDASSTLIPVLTAATAVANAGPDKVVEAFQGWDSVLDAGLNIARATLDGTSSTFSGGTPSFQWTCSPSTGVIFTAPTGGTTVVKLPNVLTDTTYTVTLAVTVGSTTSTDSVQILVKAAERAYPVGGSFKPSRKIYF